MQSVSSTKPRWLSTLWQDVSGNTSAQPPAYIATAFTNAYYNLPSFLQDFCFLYYHKQLSLYQVAQTLNISIHLAKQRWVVSIALFRILLAAKPKNPV